MGQRHNGEHALGEHVTSPVRRGLMNRLGLAVKSEAGKLADDIGSVLHFGSPFQKLRFMDSLVTLLLTKKR